MLLTVTMVFTVALSGCKQCSSDQSKDHPTEEKAKTDSDHPEKKTE